jgi:hypothetical protein
MKNLIFLLAAFLLSTVSYAQFTENYKTDAGEPAKNNIGIGLGLDYGGIGARYTHMIVPKFGLFGSVGYVLVGAGFNFGATYKFTSDKRVVPTLGAMYGYNAAIKISGTTFEEIYYGPSFSIGLEVKGKRNAQNFWNFELVVPIRSGDYHDDVDMIQNNPDIEMNDIPPVAFSIGYHFGF